MATENNTQCKTCTNCGNDIHPLEEFPGCICLDCHAAKFDKMDSRQQYRQMMHTFSGGAINVDRAAAL
jgi:hypothetical protein